MRTLLKQLEPLRESFQGDQLQYIVGAGASMAAGLPSWTSLNQRLIRAYFNEVAGGSLPTAIGYDETELEAIAAEFSGYFGKDAVIDLLRDQIDDADFYELLHDALYGGRDFFDLQPLHFELGAGVRARQQREVPAYLYTLNYDDVLEQALQAVTGEAPRSITTQASLGSNSVIHLHGYLPLARRARDGAPDVQGDIILSERDYLRTHGANADQKLQQLLSDPHSDIILLGTSLTDPRLRRLLYDRLRSRSPASNGRISVFLTRHEADRESRLARRRAVRLVSRHVRPYWESWGVNVIEIDNYEVIPAALRVIRLGAEVSKWMQKGRDFLASRDCYSGLYARDRQVQAQLYLMRQYDFIRQKFEVTHDEDFTVSFFVPNQQKPHLLQPAFRFADPRREHRRGDLWFQYPYAKVDALSPLSPHVRDGQVVVQVLDELSAEQRQLRVESLSGAEGATGIATATGILVDARETAAFFHNFDPNKRAEWKSSQTYSAMLSVPVYDTADWVPIGAACIASVKRVPFWDRLSTDAQLDLERLLRSTFRNVLEYDTCF